MIIENFKKNYKKLFEFSKVYYIMFIIPNLSGKRITIKIGKGHKEESPRFES